MTISAVSYYRGGTVDVVTPLAKALKAAYVKHGVGYRLSRFETGPNAGDWLVITTCEESIQDATKAAIDKDPEFQRIFAEIAKFATRMSREMVLDLDL